MAVDSGLPVTRNQWNHVVAAGLAMAGGLMGVVGSIVEESRSLSPLIPFVGAPIIEESLKPAGLYFMLGKWPHLLRGRLYTAALAAIAGISFAVVENLVYLYVYFPDHTRSLVIYRFTVAVFIHALASFIFGFGINRRLVASVNGEIPFLSGSRRFFITAMVIHGVYNAGAFVASATGVLKLS